MLPLAGKARISRVEAVGSAASEEVGLDTVLKVNTAEKRTHSLFRQGLYWYGAIPNLYDEWLIPLMQAFGNLVANHAFLSIIFAVI